MVWCVCLLAGLALAAHVVEGKSHYTPTWAVHVPDGRTAADRVALDHGFINLGEIFDNHYHFHHNSVRRRSVSPSSHHHRRLVKDDRVHWARQQRLLSRKKRDLIPIRTRQKSKNGDDEREIFFNDQRWSLMWYLNRGGGLDMNVLPVWREGITGRGVVVTILDDGLETDHPDLIANFDPQASYDVNSHDSDPQPRYDMIDSNRHGTRCAGEVAASANNSLCAVGVAYGASVGGVRMLDGDVTDAVEARSLSLNPQHVDIYSASWGPDDDGKTVDGPGELATRAFIEGVTKGRNGKGSIFVWASGNGGRDHDNCNCDGYTNAIWTLSIGSATERGDVPWYSEMCSSTLAATYSSGSLSEKQVVTTDLHHSCTSGHTGTSASAPLAAGICALALEANRDLTWRDMQHIVVRTSKPQHLSGGGADGAGAWRVNGAGRNVSHAFGYGLLDAAALVRTARRWRTVPPQRRCEVSAPHTDKLIPAKSQVVLQLSVSECAGVNYLEHVQAKVSLQGSRRGDLQIHLTSPAGTRVTLLANRPHDTSRSGFGSWPFMSVHTWGEAPIGVWLLEIHNEGRFLGELKQWDMVFYGTEGPAQEGDSEAALGAGLGYGVREGDDSSELHLPIVPPAHNDIDDGDTRWVSQKVREEGGGIGVGGGWRSDSASSGAGCLAFSSASSQHCIECTQTLHLYEGTCRDTCPAHTFASELFKPYQRKKISNKDQEKESRKQTSASLKRSLKRVRKEHLQSLDDRDIMLPQPPKVCLPCHESCYQCLGPGKNQCTRCNEGAILINATIFHDTLPLYRCYYEEESILRYVSLNIISIAIFVSGVGVSYLAIRFLISRFGIFKCCSRNDKLNSIGYNKLASNEDSKMETEIYKAIYDESESGSETELRL